MVKSRRNSQQKRDAQEKKDIIAAGGTVEAAGKISQKSMIIWAGIIIGLIAVFHFAVDLDWIGSCIFSISVGAPGLILTDSSLTKIERERIIVVFIAAFFVIFFWACFEQAGASLTFFADEQMNRVVNYKHQHGICISYYYCVGGRTLLRIVQTDEYTN